MEANDNASRPSDSDAELAAAGKTTKARGRPKVKIDLDEIEALARSGLNKKQVCAAIGITESCWFQKRYRDALDERYDRGRAAGVLKMKNVIFDAAGRGEWKAAESWLKANGEFENKIKVEQTGKDGGPIEVADARKSLYDKLAKLLPPDDADAAAEGH